MHNSHTVAVLDLKAWSCELNFAWHLLVPEAWVNQVSKATTNCFTVLPWSTSSLQDVWRPRSQGGFQPVASAGQDPDRQPSSFCRRNSSACLGPLGQVRNIQSPLTSPKCSTFWPAVVNIGEPELCSSTSNALVTLSLFYCVQFHQSFLKARGRFQFWATCSVQL